jgi:hypothetical protein
VAGVSVPEVVPDWMENLAKYWSEWQDLNLRPPRPERGVFGRAMKRLSSLLTAIRYIRCLPL